jgi:hypothetical protein
VYERMAARFDAPPANHWLIDTTDTEATDKIFQRLVAACRTDRLAAIKGGR